ncbi:MAG: leucine-rich repeat domain-containing protein, partial [Bacteroidales bacterium]|nr:leucine-rich repeat domain-containing protein [Bacteroidales bacterium]
VTEGYWSEESVYYGYAKSTIAAPVICDITKYSVSWTQVTGATSYVLSVNGEEIDTTEATSYTFTDSNMPETADIYEIAVKAVGENGNDSSYGDAVTATMGGFESGATYYKNTVTWNYDLAAAKYEVTVNGEKPYTVTSGNSVEVELTKAGDNRITVTGYDASGARVGYAEMSVYAYSVTIDGNGAKTSKSVVYVAQGDTLNLGTASLDHADFIGWYTQADYTMGQSDVYEGTGAEILDGSTFTGNRSTYVYAYYSYEYVDVTLRSTMGYMLDENGNEVESVTVKIKYNSTSFTLPTPDPYNEEDNFDGWNTKSNGNGTKYTTSAGESNGTAFAGETTLYAYFLSVLFYEKTTHNGRTVYSVSAGSQINSVDSITIPESYKGYGIVMNDNAFRSCVTLKEINIPDTILHIACTNDGYSSGAGAFVGCSALTAVNVYATEDNPEPLYFSAEGVLFDKINDNGDVEVLYYPYGRTIAADEEAETAAGEYTLPSVVCNEEEVDYQGNQVTHTVTTIPARVFRYRQISVMNIPSSVTVVSSYAFYGNTYLTKVNFIDDGNGTELEIGNYAFYQCTKLTDVTIPSWYTDFNVAAFDGCKSLQNVCVENSSTYKTENGVLLNFGGDTLIYYPQGRSGDVVISAIANTITTIGESAFGGNTKITSVTISNTVVTIKKSAFEDCAGILSVTFEDYTNYSSYGALTIEARAFYGCLRLKEIILPARLTNLGENAFGGCSNLSYVYFDAAANATKESLQFAAGAFGVTNNITTLEFGANVPEMDFASIFDGGHITQIIIDSNNPNYSSDENGVVYDKGVTKILYYPLARIGGYTVPETVTQIEGDTFKNRTGLTSITIGAGVNSIDVGAFDGCTFLEAVYVDDGNTNYGNGTLTDEYKDGILYKKESGNLVELLFCPVASKVEELEIADTVVKVAEKAFYGNTVIKSVEFKATSSFEFESSKETISNVQYDTSYTFY